MTDNKFEMKAGRYYRTRGFPNGRGVEKVYCIGFNKCGGEKSYNWIFATETNILRSYDENGRYSRNIESEVDIVDYWEGE